MSDDAEFMHAARIVLLISHNEASLESLCDCILYINAETKKLAPYHTGYNECQTVLEAGTASTCRQEFCIRRPIIALAIKPYSANHRAGTPSEN